MKPLFYFCVATFLSLFIFGTALHGADIYWNPVGEGVLQENGSHWQGGTAPGSGQTAEITGGTNSILGAVNTDGDFDDVAFVDDFHLIISGGDTSAKPVTPGKNVEFQIGRSQAGTMTVGNGTFTAPGRVAIGFLSSGDLTIDNAGQFIITGNGDHLIGHAAGTVTVNSGGLFDVRNGSYTYLGFGTGGTGTLTVNSGGEAKFNTPLIVTGTGTLDVAGGKVTVSGELHTNTSADTTTLVKLSQGAEMSVSGEFVALYNTNGKGKFVFDISDAKLTVGGNFWGGLHSSNDHVPLDGEEYMAYFYFRNGSTVTAKEAWLGMNAKTYILIEDGAVITSTDNNAGIGWGKAAADSLLVMEGGEFNAIHFNVGNDVSATMNQSGGLVKASSGFNIRHGSTVNLFGSGKIDVADILRIDGGSQLKLSGGEVKAGHVLVDSSGSLKMSNGEVKTGSVRVDNGGSLDISGGTVRVNDDINMNTSADSVVTVKLSGDADVTARNFYALRGNENGGSENPFNGKGKFVFEIGGDAKLSLDGDFWCGYPHNESTHPALDGEEFAAYLTFSGNSMVVAEGEAWVGMNAKSKIIITDGASITGKTGHSGIGWSDRPSSAGSLMIMDGGEFNANVFCVGNGARLEQSGGTITSGEFHVQPGGSSVYLSDSAAVNVASAFCVNSRGLLDMSGGWVDAGWMRIDADATMNLSGGTLNVWGSLQKDGDFNFTGGTLNAQSLNFHLVQNNNGILSPGGDGAIGSTMIENAYTLNGGTMRFDLDLEGYLDDLINPAPYRDLLTVTGTATFAPGTFVDILFDSSLLTPDLAGMEFQIMDLANELNVNLTAMLTGDGARYWNIYQNPDNYGVFITYNGFAENDDPAVPEPGTWALLMLGGVVLGFAARRKYQRNFFVYRR